MIFMAGAMFGTMAAAAATWQIWTAAIRSRRTCWNAVRSHFLDWRRTRRCAPGQASLAYSSRRAGVRRRRRYGGWRDAAAL